METFALQLPLNTIVRTHQFPRGRGGTSNFILFQEL